MFRDWLVGVLHKQELIAQTKSMMKDLHKELHGQGLKKREAKYQAKKLQCIRLYFEAKVKPMKIAKLLKVDR